MLLREHDRLFYFFPPQLKPMLDLPIQDGLAAAVQVVKFLLGDRVIDVHGRHTQFTSL